MALTLNQIISRLRSLALSHRQINHFYFGDPHEFTANGDITYPACFVESQPGVMNRTTKEQQFNFRVYFLDKVHVSQDTEENETEVLSDMSSVADDMIALILNPLYQDDWIVSETVIKALGTEQFDDMVAGVVIEVGIIVEFLPDSCAVPADDVEFEQTFDMPRTKIHTYTATGDENSFSVPTLSGKHILAVWRAGYYKRAVATAPDDSEKVQVGTTDLGSGRGILGTGTVTLQTGDLLIEDEKVDFLYYGT